MANSNAWASDTFTFRFPSDEVLAWIGEIVILFNLVEDRVGWIIAGLAELHGNNARAMLGGLPFEAKLRVLQCFVADRCPESGRPQMLSWLQRVEGVQARRNGFVHSILHDDGAGTRRSSYKKSTKGFLIQHQRVGPAEFKSLIIDMRRLLLDINDHALMPNTMERVRDGRTHIEFDSRLQPITGKGRDRKPKS